MLAARGAPKRASRGAVLLGVALGFVIALVLLRFAPGAKNAARLELGGEVQRIPGAILPEDEGALAEVLVQYAPNLEPVVADAYHDFLGALDPATRIVAVAPRGATPPLRAMLDRIDASLASRVRIVEVDGPITVWSKDRALVLAPFATQPRATFVIP